MKRTIHLHGSLGERFGGPYTFRAASIRQIGSALSVNLPGFRKAVADGRFRVVRGAVDGDGDIDGDELDIGLGRTAEVHIVPVVAGAIRGIGKFVFGAALIGGALLFAPAAGLGATAFSVAGSSVTFGNILMTGVAIGLGGVAQMLSPQVGVGDYGDRESPEQRSSFLIRGPTNTTEQGQVIPLVFGRDVVVGSVVVNAGITTERI